jgi:hypothetical protein
VQSVLPPSLRSHRLQLVDFVMVPDVTLLMTFMNASWSSAIHKSLRLVVVAITPMHLLYYGHCFIIG